MKQVREIGEERYELAGISYRSIRLERAIGFLVYSRHNILF